MAGLSPAASEFFPSEVEEEWKEEELDGEDDEFAQVNSPDDDDIGAVVKAAKTLETLLKKKFDAHGNGIGELVYSIGWDRRILSTTKDRLRYIQKIRNKFVHTKDEDCFTDSFSREIFDAVAESVRVDLLQAASRPLYRRPTAYSGSGGSGHQHPAFRNPPQLRDNSSFPSLFKNSDSQAPSSAEVSQTTPAGSWKERSADVSTATPAPTAITITGRGVVYKSPPRMATKLFTRPARTTGIVPAPQKGDSVPGLPPTQMRKKNKGPVAPPPPQGLDGMSRKPEDTRLINRQLRHRNLPSNVWLPAGKRKLPHWLPNGDKNDTPKNHCGRGWYPSIIDWVDSGMPTYQFGPSLMSSEDMMAMAMDASRRDFVRHGKTQTQEEEEELKRAIAVSIAAYRAANARVTPTSEVEQELEIERALAASVADEEDLMVTRALKLSKQQQPVCAQQERVMDMGRETGNLEDQHSEMLRSLELSQFDQGSPSRKMQTENDADFLRALELSRQAHQLRTGAEPVSPNHHRLGGVPNSSASEWETSDMDDADTMQALALSRQMSQNSSLAGTDDLPRLGKESIPTQANVAQDSVASVSHADLDPDLDPDLVRALKLSQQDMLPTHSLAEVQISGGLQVAIPNLDADADILRALELSRQELSSSPTSPAASLQQQQQQQQVSRPGHDNAAADTLALDMLRALELSRLDVPGMRDVSDKPAAEGMRAAVSSTGVSFPQGPSVPEEYNCPTALPAEIDADLLKVLELSKKEAEDAQAKEEEDADLQAALHSSLPRRRASEAQDEIDEDLAKVLELSMRLYQRRSPCSCQNDLATDECAPAAKASTEPEAVDHDLALALEMSKRETGSSGAGYSADETKCDPDADPLEVCRKWFPTELQSLVKMGFDELSAAQALTSRGGNAEQSIELLLSRLSGTA